MPTTAAARPAAPGDVALVDADLFVGQELHGAPPSRRVQNFVGSLVRTLLVAAVVAGAVCGGRFAYQWYQDREQDFIAELPAEPVAPPDARFVSFTERSTNVSVDLATGDALATGPDNVSVARRDGWYWIQATTDAAFEPATAAALDAQQDLIDAIDSASLRTLTDVLPVNMYDHLTAVADESSSLPGTPLAGDTVIEVGEVRPDIREVTVRQLTFSLDGAGLAAAHPHEAAFFGGAIVGTHEIVVWVDETGVVRKMTTPPSLGADAGDYTLNAASTTGAAPLDGVTLVIPADFGGTPESPVEEAQS